jgi:hypothetical protein
MLVTTTVSPPPAKDTEADDVPAARDTVPVGRNAVMEPTAIVKPPISSDVLDHDGSLECRIGRRGNGG